MLRFKRPEINARKRRLDRTLVLDPAAAQHRHGHRRTAAAAMTAILRDEIVRTMKLLGVATLDELARSR
ncbi:hypothetical protein [Georgenia sunbinii]|uniref:hypothetical protein n=1 Tax=Georgenia sunbinii TaxID=3117728 RepID=UPI002F267757